MQLRIRKLISILTILVTAVCFSAGYFSVPEKAAAATDSLTINVGFYGGPYYKIKKYSYAEMCKMSDGNIWTYSGTDSGYFMRICYAWGVQLADLTNKAGIDVDSVKYFHMGTSDSYGETYSTFSADDLFQTRYFYPNMVQLADPDGSSEQQIDFSKVDSSITADAEEVPTLIAIGATEFSRSEATRVAKSGEYKNPSKSDLPETSRYRLLFGQTGLGNLSQAQNVRTSDKNIYEINVQLAGAPNIKVTKKLKSGKKNQVGSKYEITVDVELPDSYSYIGSSVQKKLKKQILKKVKAKYDDSVVKLKKNSNGSYDMEIVGEGNTDVKFSYSRSEYDGSSTSADGTLGVKGEKATGTSSSEGDSTEKNNSDKKKTSAKEGSGSSKSTKKSSDNSKTGIKKTDKKTKKTESEDTDGSSDGEWQSADLEGSSGAAIETEEEDGDGLGTLAGGTAVLFTAGVLETVIRFLKSIR